MGERRARYAAGREMIRRVRPLAAFAALGAIVVAPGVARAQIPPSSSGVSSSGGMTGGSGTENVSSALPNPNRALLQNGQYVDVTNNPRPLNLNPTGVSFSDCEQDLKLTFPIVVSGFNGGSGIEVWAGTTDCTQFDARGNGQVPTCWRLSPQAQQLLDPTTTSMSFDVYARDVMRYLGAPSANPTADYLHYDSTWHSGPQGESACREQQSDAAVTVNVFFVPIQVSASVGQATGTAYQYALNTDTVAPPPPPSVTLGFGDTLLTVNWVSPGNDPDIAGFAVWTDPPGASAAGGGGSCNCGSTPGAGGASSYVGDDGAAISVGDDGAASSTSSGGEGGSTLVCEDAGASDSSGPLDAAADVDSGAAGATDASDAQAGGGPTDGSVDAAGDAATIIASDGAVPPGCHYVNVASGAACSSSVLSSTFVVGGGGTVTADGSVAPAPAPTPVATTGEGGELEGGVTLSGGGISAIPPQYKGGEVDDRTATQLTLTGLTNGVNYVVAVTSVDGSGNVGPVSTPQCAQPQPVDDFWKTYKQEGGGASGCALEGAGPVAQMPVFGAAVAAILALLRRRRRS